MYKLGRPVTHWMGGWQQAVNDLIAKGFTKKEAKKLLRSRKKAMEKSVRVQGEL
ncbi:MAG: hypothetical protein V3T32_07990 [Thermodesulfobacteriota bacterium]